MNLRLFRHNSSVSARLSSTLAFTLLLMCGLGPWLTASGASATAADTGRLLAHIDQLGIASAVDVNRTRPGKNKEGDTPDQLDFALNSNLQTLAVASGQASALAPARAAIVLFLKHNPSAPRAPPSY